MAIYDLTTPNTSFIKMYKTLKDLGIKNNKFFLTLYDETLQGVDPHSKNLTHEQQVRIQAEVMRNRFYYLREVIRIPESGGSIPFQLTRANLAQTYLMMNNINIFEVLPRQNGKTIGAECNYTHSYHFEARNTSIIFSNKLFDDSKLNIKRFNDITDLLPDYLKSHLNPSLDTKNLTKISCAKNNNAIDAMSTARTISDADKLGRGCTVAMIWYDEFAFLKYNDTIYSSAGPAYAKAAESAARNGTSYGILITTTPNDLDTSMGKYAHQMKIDSCVFDELWYDWDIQRVKRHIHKNSENDDFVYIEFDYIQLGHDEEWFKKQSRILNNDLIKIKREILLEWTLANDTSPFSEEQLTQIEAYAKPHPIGCLFIKNQTYKINIFKEMRNIINKSWIVSIDIAGGLSKDATAISVIDPATYEQVAIFKNNTISIPDLAELLIELVDIYMPNAVIVPERNNQGISLIQILLKSNIAKNIYYETKERLGEKIIEDPRGGSKYVKHKKTVRVYGIDTTSKSRDIMINEILSTFVNEKAYVFTNKDIFDEIRTLERKTSGKIEHRDGCHDDLLFSWLVGMYAILYGNNINKFLKIIYNNDSQVNRNASIGQSIKRFSDVVNERKNDEILSDIYNEFNKRNPHSEVNNSKFNKGILNFISDINKRKH